MTSKYKRWDEQRILNKWLKNNYRAKTELSELRNITYFYDPTDQLSIAELEEILLKCAKLVNELGEEYLEIFKRAERELAKAEQNLNMMEKVRILANQNTQSHIESNLFKP